MVQRVIYKWIDLSLELQMVLVLWWFLFARGGDNLEMDLGIDSLCIIIIGQQNG